MILLSVSEIHCTRGFCDEQQELGILVVGFGFALFGGRVTLIIIRATIYGGVFAFRAAWTCYHRDIIDHEIFGWFVIQINIYSETEISTIMRCLEIVCRCKEDLRNEFSGGVKSLLGHEGE